MSMAAVSPSTSGTTRRRTRSTSPARPRAAGRCYYQVLMSHGLDHWGRYIDGYQLVDGRWLFSSRRVTMDGYVPGGWGAANATT